MFFSFFSVLYKRTQRSLRSFWFHKSYRNDKFRKKVRKRKVRSILGLKKSLKFFFAIYIYIYIYLYIYKYIYISIYQFIYIYIYLYVSINIYFKKEQGLGMRSFQKNATFCVLLHKNVVFFAFFYVLCIFLHSLRFFTFLRKVRKRMHRS